MDDSDGKAPQSGGIIRESPSIHLIDRKQSLGDESDCEYDSEANFRHEGCKRYETITPTNIGEPLRDDFFDDIESCSIELANLDDITLFYLLPPILFYKRRHPGPCFPAHLLFFQIREFDLVQEATLVVDDDLLEVVTLATKSCGTTAQLSISKDVGIVTRVTSPPVMASLHE